MHIFLMSFQQWRKLIVNGKKAKLMRKFGKVDKKTKKMYNSLTHSEKGVLKEIYKEAPAEKK